MAILKLNDTVVSLNKSIVEYQPRAMIPTPSQLIYNGTSQSPIWTNYNEEIMTKEENLQINAGTYSTKFTLNPTYKWSDNTVGEKEIVWTIEKFSSLWLNPISFLTLAPDKDYTNVSLTTNIPAAYFINRPSPEILVSGESVQVSRVAIAAPQGSIILTFRVTKLKAGLDIIEISIPGNENVEMTPACNIKVICRTEEKENWLLKSDLNSSVSCNYTGDFISNNENFTGIMFQTGVI